MTSKILSMNVIKKRPVLTGAIIIGGGLLFYFMFMRPSDSGSSRSQSMGYTDTQVYAGSELVALQQQQAQQGAQIQGQLAALQIQGNIALAEASTNANLQRDLAALSLQAAQMDNAVDLAGIAAQRDVQMLGMENSRQIAELQVQGELEALALNVGRDIAVQNMLTQAQVSITGMASQVQMAGISSQERLGRATIDANVAMVGNMLNLQAVFAEQETRREQARIDRDIVNIRETNRTARNASDNALMGDVVSTVGMGLMMMSSIHIKTIDAVVDCNKCLNAIKAMPVDFWRYMDGTTNEIDSVQHVGTYSQDFYREIGAKDWEKRDAIAVVDYMGALTGAIKALAKERDN